MRELLVVGEKTFKIRIPDDAKITFGPWSPPQKSSGMYDREGAKTGTLRIYQGNKENIVGCFSGVKSFRDLSMGYAEEVVREEGSVIWKDDEQGYVRESKQQRSREWVDAPKLIEAPARTPRRRKK